MAKAKDADRATTNEDEVREVGAPNPGPNVPENQEGATGEGVQHFADADADENHRRAVEIHDKGAADQ